MKTVLAVIGTRPEAVKMAPVVRALAGHPGRARTVVCTTGQHAGVVDRVLDLFGVKADVALRVMRPGQGLAALTARLVEEIDRVIDRARPDWVLAQGDTATVVAAALASYYRRVPFGHVEAGLRTGDRDRPFPEEVNRRVADLVAHAHFAPTERAREVLLREGHPPGSVYLTGNTVVDALRAIAALPYDPSLGALAALPNGGRVVLITAHRRENLGGPLREICQAVRDLASAYLGRDVHFVYPLHLNPDARRPALEVLRDLPNVFLTDPLDYLDFVNLLKRSTLALTDSGGVQEEALCFRVPVLVTRETTERTEGVDAGAARVIGTRRESIVAEVSRLLDDPAAAALMACDDNPYGDGRASERVAAVVLETA